MAEVGVDKALLMACTLLDAAWVTSHFRNSSCVAITSPHFLFFPAYDSLDENGATCHVTSAPDTALFNPLRDESLTV